MSYVNENLYDDKFYNDLDRTVRTVDPIVSLIIDIANPKSVADIGCAIGVTLSCFKSKGITDVLGIDGFWVKEENLLIDKSEFMRHDLSTPLTLPRRYDLAISTEVAEHIEEKNADGFVKNLTDVSDIVLFSAAVPGQGGTNHVNERWPQYWIEKFNSMKYEVIDCIRAQIWNRDDVEWWYKQNLFLFCKSDKVSSLNLPDRAPPIYDVIHPDLYYTKMQAIINISKLVPHDKQKPSAQISGNKCDICKILSDFLAETGPLLEQIDTLPPETAKELYNMYKTSAQTASDNIPGIDPGLYEKLREGMEKILNRIAG